MRTVQFRIRDFGLNASELPALLRNYKRILLDGVEFTTVNININLVALLQSAEYILLNNCKFRHPAVFKRLMTHCHKLKKIQMNNVQVLNNVSAENAPLKKQKLNQDTEKNYVECKLILNRSDDWQVLKYFEGIPAEISKLHLCMDKISYSDEAAIIQTMFDWIFHNMLSVFTAIDIQSNCYNSAELCKISTSLSSYPNIVEVNNKTYNTTMFDQFKPYLESHYNLTHFKNNAVLTKEDVGAVCTNLSKLVNLSLKIQRVGPYYLRDKLIKLKNLKTLEITLPDTNKPFKFDISGMIMVNLKFVGRQNQELVLIGSTMASLKTFAVENVFLRRPSLQHIFRKMSNLEHLTLSTPTYVSFFLLNFYFFN
jgi:hypothetical protein